MSENNNKYPESSGERQAETDLWESQNAFIILINNLPGMVFKCTNDHEWTMQFVSDGCFQLTGYNPQDLLHNRELHYIDLIHPDDRNRVWNEIHNQLKKQLLYTTEYRINTATGEEKWVSEKGRTLKAKNGGISFLEGFITDITAYKDIEKELKASEVTLRVIFNNVNDAIFIHELDGRIIDVNDKMLQMYGVNREQALKFTIQEDYSAFDNPPDVLPLYWEEVINGKKKFFTWKARRPNDGSSFDVEVLLNRLDVYNKDVILATVRDITAYKRNEEALRQSEERYQEILASIEEGYLEADLKGKITFCNEATLRVVGYTTEEIIGMDYRKLFFDHEKVFRAFNRVYLTGKPDKGYTMQLLCKDGSSIFVEFSISLKLDKEGKPVGFRGIGRDVTERRQFEEKLKYISFHDQLTGLHNRAYMEQELRRLNKNREHAVSIILVDLDGLKLINDTMGHKQGDEMLKICAGILKESLRGSDVLARFGGDEFAIILPDTGEQAAVIICNRIRRLIEKYNKNNPDIHLSISMGVSTSPAESDSLEETFNEADDYMYQEKLYRSAGAHKKIAETLMLKLDERDYIAEGHAKRLKEKCMKLGQKVNLSSRQLKDLALLTQVHDIGKVSVPENILYKKEPLTEEDWKVIKEHAEKGYRIARSIQKLASVADLILRHHERWDGTGYPIGLKDESIPIECRILAIIDAYDVMTHDRPYRKAKTHKEAIKELKRNAGTQFDPSLIEEFLKIYNSG